MGVKSVHFVSDEYQESRRIYAACLLLDHMMSHAQSDCRCDSLWDSGRFVEAEPLFRGALVVRRETLGDKDLDTLKALNGLANLQFQTGALCC